MIMTLPIIMMIITIIVIEEEEDQEKGGHGSESCVHIMCLVHHGVFLRMLD